VVVTGGGAVVVGTVAGIVDPGATRVVVVVLDRCGDDEQLAAPRPRATTPMTPYNKVRQLPISPPPAKRCRQEWGLFSPSAPPMPPSRAFLAVVGAGQVICEAPGALQPQTPEELRSDPVGGPIDLPAQYPLAVGRWSFLGCPDIG